MGLRAMEVWQEYAENEAWAVFDKARQVFGCWYLENPTPKKHKCEDGMRQVGDKKFTNFNDVRDEIERQTDQVAGVWAWDLEILPSIFPFFPTKLLCISAGYGWFFQDGSVVGWFWNLDWLSVVCEVLTRALWTIPSFWPSMPRGLPTSLWLTYLVSHVYLWRAVIRKMMWRRPLRSYGEWDSSYFSYEPSTFCSHQPWFNDCSHEGLFLTFSWGLWTWIRKSSKYCDTL